MIRYAPSPVVERVVGRVDTPGVGKRHDGKISNSH
jgi:hypothetical protein